MVIYTMYGFLKSCKGVLIGFLCEAFLIERGAIYDNKKWKINFKKLERYRY